MQLTTYGSLHSPTGYDNVHREFIKNWYQQGHEILSIDFPAWSFVKINTPIDEILQKIEKTQPTSPEFQINFCLPDQAKLNLCTPNFIYTMFEASGICPMWVNSLKGIDGIIVPSQFNKESFMSSGVPESKLIVIHPPMDINHILNDAVPVKIESFCGDKVSNYKNRFLFVGEYVDRKDVDSLIQIFCDTIKKDGSDNTCLILKLNSNSGLKLDYFRAKLENIIKKEHAPIFLITDFLEDKQMLGLYNYCTHYLSMSLGEGVELSALTMGILGKKVIAPESTGFKEYLNDKNSYPIKVQAIGARVGGPVAAYYAGLQLYVPIKFCAKRMIRQALEDTAKGDNTRNELLSKQLKVAYDSNVITTKLLTEIVNFKPKRTPLVNTPKSVKETNVVLICKSLGGQCGISDYTIHKYKGMQDESNKVKFGGSMLLKGESVEYQSQLDSNDIHLINLELEYSFIPEKRLDLLIQYCNRSNIVFTTTMHTVNPLAASYHEILRKNNANIIVQSDLMKSTLIEKCGIKEELIKVIPQGISKEFIREPIKRSDDARFRIAFFGLGYHHKGIDKILQYAKQYGEGKEFLILSSKPTNTNSNYFERMHEIAKSLNNVNIQWISDYIDEESIVNALATSNLIFLPYSSYGGIGTSAAVRTCMKAGVPIAGFPNEFFDDVIQENSLMTFIGNDPNNYNEWSDSLNRFINNNLTPEYKKEYIIKRDKFVEDYNWVKIGGMYLDHFNKLIFK